ncbi:ComEA family DNA-binding protein [Plantactinospora siamensis]|uniref:ComEA family DNA-binding protein n=1 Tax=Plantactinospora siamensis TaxID=555372 RepID=A0ABV6NUJ1_9ACTN
MAVGKDEPRPPDRAVRVPDAPFEPAAPGLIPPGEAPDAPPVVARLGGLGRSAFDPGRPGVRALAAVVAVVVGGAAFWAWRARPDVDPVPVAGVPSAASGRDPSPSETDPGPTGASPGAEVVVAVAGKVRRPGLVRLPAGARLADAIDAAGGALPGVDVALLNPARRLVDGELVAVGVTPPAAGEPAVPGGAPGGGQPGAAGPGGPVAGGKVNLNTATLAELDALPGVGPVLAQRILDRRQQGPYRSVSDLRQVEGIGQSRYEDLKDLVTV